MIGYFGTKISDHMIQTKQGYLICLEVPIARTGFQEYAPSELEMPGDDVIKVYRDPSQVFDPMTVASFEGNSVTLYHPPQDLDANNDSAYGKGHIQNVRVGTEPDAEGNRYLIADLHVKEANLISQIQSGAMREVSCGYSYRLEPTEDGNLQQVEIRGNHLAIVPKGRAGREASIQDHAAPVRTRKVPMSIFKHILGLGLQQYAKDAEPEKIADAMKECAADAEPEKKEEPAAQVTEPEKTVDAADPMAEIRDALKSIGDRLDKLEKPEDEVESEDAEIKPEQDEEAEEAEEAEESEDAEPEQAEEQEQEQEQADDEEIVIPAGDRPENPIPGADKKVGDALKVMRKAVAASGDRKAIDAFNSLLPQKSGNTKDGYKQIATRKATDHTVVDERAAANDFLAKAKAMHRKQSTK
jgi:hypothetical protein